MVSIYKNYPIKTTRRDLLNYELWANNSDIKKYFLKKMQMLK